MHKQTPKVAEGLMEKQHKPFSSWKIPHFPQMETKSLLIEFLVGEYFIINSMLPVIIR